MFGKLKNIISFLLLLLFLLFVIFYYFSNDNLKKISTNRVGFSENLENSTSLIPLLKNDTENSIDYIVSNVENKKIKKRYFWELLK